jgi:hypothetical protein
VSADDANIETDQCTISISIMPMIVQNPSIYRRAILYQRALDLTKDWWTYGLTAKGE